MLNCPQSMEAMTLYYCDLLGTFVFALTGALVAIRRRMDLFGMLVLAAITAVGGGTVRDVILGADGVFWTRDGNYIFVIILGMALPAIVQQDKYRTVRVLKILDAFGLAIFTVIGASKTLSLGYSGPVAVIMGCISGVFGGIFRDTLAGQVPLILRRDVYATTSIAGAILFVIFAKVNLPQPLNILLTATSVFTLRLTALQKGWNLPVIQPKNRNGTRG